MSLIGKFRAVVVGLMLLVYVVFLGVVVMSASASAAAADTQTHRMHVTADGDEITVHYEGEEPVVVQIEAVEGAYAGEGTYRLDPGDALRLPYPAEPVVLRVTADAEHFTATALVAFDYVEIECGDGTARQLVPTEITYEWEVERDGHTRSGSHHVEPAPSEVTCPEPQDASDERADRNSGESDRQTYEQWREQRENLYEDGPTPTTSGDKDGSYDYNKTEG